MAGRGRGTLNTHMAGEAPRSARAEPQVAGQPDGVARGTLGAEAGNGADLRGSDGSSARTRNPAQGADITQKNDAKDQCRDEGGQRMQARDAAARQLRPC